MGFIQMTFRQNAQWHARSVWMSAVSTHCSNFAARALAARPLSVCRGLHPRETHPDPWCTITAAKSYSLEPLQLFLVSCWNNQNGSGVKKSKNFHLSCGQVQLNFYLSCCQITLGIQGNITWHCIFCTCPADIGWKYMLVLIEILLVPGARTSDFFTPAGHVTDMKISVENITQV